MYRLLRPLLFALTWHDPEVAHDLIAWLTDKIGRVPVLLRLVRRIYSYRPPEKPRLIDLSVTIAGVEFPNPFIIAAGLVKAPTPGILRFWEAVGAGGIEIGTVVPRKQVGRPRPRMKRLWRSIVNWCGWNSDGVEAVCNVLEKFHREPRKMRIGVSIGANSDTVTGDGVIADILSCILWLNGLVDYFTINGSCHNVPSGDLFVDEAFLRRLLEAIRARRPSLQAPVFLKCSPDSTEETIGMQISLCREFGIGLVGINTSRQLAIERGFEKVGVYSGPELLTLNKRFIRSCTSRGQSAIACGGLWTGQDAFELLKDGAAAFQVLTAIVFGGPGTIRRILAELVHEMQRPGHIDKVSEIHGEFRRVPRSPRPN